MITSKEKSSSSRTHPIEFCTAPSEWVVIHQYGLGVATSCLPSAQKHAMRKLKLGKKKTADLKIWWAGRCPGPTRPGFLITAKRDPSLGGIATVPGHGGSSLLNCRVTSQERKSSSKSKFWGRISGGRPCGYPGGRPGAKTSVKPSKSWKNKHFGVDVHDPKARMSMTPGGSKKTSVRKTSG